MMCSNFNDMNFKFDVQKSEITEIKNEIKTQNIQIKSDFNEKFDKIQREIKNSNHNLIKQCDKVIKKLGESLMQIENQKVVVVKI